MEKSLAKDCFQEECRFRIVTQRDVMADLRVLREPLGSSVRRSNGTKLGELQEKIGSQIDGFQSENGNDAVFWVDRTFWDVQGAEEDVINKNLLTLDRYADRIGAQLAPDQREEVYRRLLTIVKDAALAKNIENKKLLRQDLALRLNQVIAETQHPATIGGGDKLRGKMEKAGLPTEYIETALELRRHFRTEVLSPKYMPGKDIQRVVGEVQSTLHCLLVDLDAGVIAESGTDFYRRCISSLEQLRTELPMEPPPPKTVVYGSMYELTNRCLHRFARVDG